MFKFLQNLALNQMSDITDTGALLGPILALGIAILVVVLIALIAIYIYFALAFLKIARKVGLSENVAGLAWVPFIGPMLVSYIVSGMHWWPWIVLLGLIIPILNIGVIMFLAVISIIWMWKTFEAVGRPGWWSLVVPMGGLIGFLLTFASPVLGVIINLIAGVAYLVFIGIAAWGSGAQQAVKPAKPVKLIKK